MGGAETELDTEWYGSVLAWSKDDGALPLEVTILLSGMTKTHFNLESINWFPSVSFLCEKKGHFYNNSQKGIETDNNSICLIEIFDYIKA